MTTDAPAQREPGWYWVRRKSTRISDQLNSWRIAEWAARFWDFTDGLTCYDDQIAEIGPRILPPGEPNEATVEERVAAIIDPPPWNNEITASASPGYARELADRRALSLQTARAALAAAASPTGDQK